MEQILRKSLLYRSGLGFYCINHVQGCHHGCMYPCYAFMMARSHGRAKYYTDWCRPAIVANAVELLSGELKRMKKRPGTIHMCLTTDPFMNAFPEVTAMSLELIAIINSYGIRCSVLTKGIIPAELADGKKFLAGNILGISLVSLSEEFRKRWEPGAVPAAARIEAIRKLHDQGCTTLVHMEPYPTPNIIDQDLPEILESIAFVDSIYFSGWNYNQVVKQYEGHVEFYRRQADEVRRFCRERSIEFG